MPAGNNNIVYFNFFNQKITTNSVILLNLNLNDNYTGQIANVSATVLSYIYANGGVSIRLQAGETGVNFTADQIVYVYYLIL